MEQLSRKVSLKDIFKKKYFQYKKIKSKIVPRETIKKIPSKSNDSYI